METQWRLAKKITVGIPVKGSCQTIDSNHSPSMVDSQSPLVTTNRNARITQAMDPKVNEATTILVGSRGSLVALVMIAGSNGSGSSSTLIKFLFLVFGFHGMERCVTLSYTWNELNMTLKNLPKI
jgi:hypothetical protein